MYLHKFVELERVQLNTPVMIETWYIYKIEPNIDHGIANGIILLHGKCTSRNHLSFRETFGETEFQRKLVLVLPEHEQIIEHLKGEHERAWYKEERR